MHAFCDALHCGGCKVKSLPSCTARMPLVVWSLSWFGYPCILCAAQALHKHARNRCSCVACMYVGGGVAWAATGGVFVREGGVPLERVGVRVVPEDRGQPQLSVSWRV